MEMCAGPICATGVQNATVSWLKREGWEVGVWRVGGLETKAIHRKQLAVQQQANHKYQSVSRDAITYTFSTVQCTVTVREAVPSTSSCSDEGLEATIPNGGWSEVHGNSWDWQFFVGFPAGMWPERWAGWLKKQKSDPWYNFGIIVYVHRPPYWRSCLLKILLGHCSSHSINRGRVNRLVWSPGGVGWTFAFRPGALPAAAAGLRSSSGSFIKSSPSYGMCEQFLRMMNGSLISVTTGPRNCLTNHHPLASPLLNGGLLGFPLLH